MAFIDRLTELATSDVTLGPADAEEAALSFEDTLAVTYGGWMEPVMQSLLPLYRGSGAPLLDGTATSAPEMAAFLHATAGHALDYDDVHTTSVTHPSVVVVHAILALIDQRPDLAERAGPALAVGLATNIAVGKIMGFGHYDKGWHATSTIGPLAGAAALGHLLGLGAEQVRHALALASAQSGGMQANFGAMAKPVQAGNAAAASLRAALMAEAGVTGAPDIFGPNGYFELFAAGPLAADPETVIPQIEMNSFSRKLYPCCYLTHRLIASGLQVRDQLEGAPLSDDTVIEMQVPPGAMKPLQVFDPATGLEAKFCAAYTVAAALDQGRVGLADFEDDAVHRPNIRRLMSMVQITEEPLTGEMPTGVDHGTVHLVVRKGNTTLAETAISHHPGSPASPATASQIGDKIGDCLNRYTRLGGTAPTAQDFREGLRHRLHLPPTFQ